MGINIQDPAGFDGMCPERPGPGPGVGTRACCSAHARLELPCRVPPPPGWSAVGLTVRRLIQTPASQGAEICRKIVVGGEAPERPRPTAAPIPWLWLQKFCVTLWTLWTLSHRVGGCPRLECLLLALCFGLWGSLGSSEGSSPGEQVETNTHQAHLFFFFSSGTASCSIGFLSTWRVDASFQPWAKSCNALILRR